MVRGLTPLYFPCNGNTEKGAFPTFYDEITLLNVVKYTCYHFQNFRLIGGNSHGLQQSQSRENSGSQWKEAEEKKLRELGVDEDTIQRLHTYDWEQFNKERQYLQRQVEWSPYVELISAQDLELPVEDTDALLDSIEDMELLRILSKEDKLTIQIAFLKMSGFNGYEIADRTGLTQNGGQPSDGTSQKKIEKIF